ncbi:response regulator [Stenotrophobium rhamnosiphilum]|uniref:DNA-binding response regulator n=1 Tax=Stenotrophobium rhamnosiphilum TaxID=2029166 RepID=A0A2T5MGL6_9GAMM|nr:response regulator transcription factor [Stenotrophobium rhamnosiphilum]PTU31724.1 DNA-binding response regulator [Stenotrophobium rhamnosiphilum]
MENAKLIIADDHPLFRAALREAVTRLLPGVAIVEAVSFQSLQEAVGANSDADLILLDLHMPGTQGFSSLVYLRAQYPAIPVAIVSAAEEPAVIRRSLDFGAAAYIPKSTPLEQIGIALRSVLDGGVWVPEHIPTSTANDAENKERDLAQRVASLTPQQLRVLMMLADGRLNKQIAGDLDVSEATIKAHMTAVLRKLGLYRRTQAAVLAQRLLQAESASLLMGEEIASEPDAE